MTALILDGKNQEFNYDSSRKTMQLKSRRLWEGRWLKKWSHLMGANHMKKLIWLKQSFDFIEVVIQI